MRRAIALVAGETAGHVQPALAVADAYRRAHDGVDVLFFGTPGTVGAGVVPAGRFPLVPLHVTPLAGMSVAGKLGSAGRTMASMSSFSGRQAVRWPCDTAGGNVCRGEAGQRGPCVGGCRKG